MTYRDGRNCFVFIDHDKGDINPVSLQLLSEADHLMNSLPQKEDVVAVWLGEMSETNHRVLSEHGATQIIHCGAEALNQYDVLNYTDVISEIIDAHHPQSFLFGGTVKGRELAPRISARVHTGLTADATQIDLDEESEMPHSLAITRPAFGGNLFATIITPNHVPQMATIRANVFAARKINTAKDATIIPFETSASLQSPIVVESSETIEAAQNTIADAKLIVSAGRGVKDCLDMVQSFANTLGAELGASRALVDDGLVQKPSQVGQTGTTVRPSVYLACGISGAVQHTAGMDKSETIIAINTDENAPIFDVADLGIVGDAKTILPALLERLES